MIERYTRKEMNDIFSPHNKFSLWMEIEILACEAQAELGATSITGEEAAWIRAHAGFEVSRIDEIERETNHDVIAFLTNMAEHIDADWPALGDASVSGDALASASAPASGDASAPASAPRPSRWVHYGMTSSDLGDTALCCQISQALDLIIRDVRTLGATAKARAFEHKDTLCVGRTHGIHAEPMTFGMKFASWAWALKRAEQRLLEARAVIATGAISGAVGSYSSIDPFVERYVCDRLGLVPDPLSTQVIARDRHAQVASALAVTAATLEQMATEVRSLQKSDTLEAEEPFSAKQKGSSAMPHKRNPIISERVCGLARVVKANAQVAFDNVALWHERDISHSSAERVALVDSFLALDYILSRMQGIVAGLVVYPENCRANLARTRGLIYSSKLLLALIDTGITREAAYEVVRRNAMAVWEDIQQARPGADFRKRVEDDSEVCLSASELDDIFDPWHFLTRIARLFERLEKLEF